MSLFRAVPPLNLAATVDDSLSPTDLRDYGKLLYWIFFFPQAVRDYVARNAANQSSNATLLWMATVVLVVTILGVTALTGVGQVQLVGLSPLVAFQGALGSAPIGVGIAVIVYLLALRNKQPARGIVLGVASGVISAMISLFGLGELWQSAFLDMGSALGYGFVAGSGAGILMNLDMSLGGDSKVRSPLHWVTALAFGLLIFIVNSINHSDFWVDLSQENLLATLSGVLTFTVGSRLGMRRPLDWWLGKLYLNVQLLDIGTDEQSRKFTQGATLASHYAPRLEALFAPVAAVQFPVQPRFPHVTLYAIPQLRHYLETWLEYDWERGLLNADQLWRYTNQQKLVMAGVQQILHEQSGEDQVSHVAQFVNKLNPIDWPMILYPVQRNSITIDKLQQESKPPANLDTVAAAMVRQRSQRKEVQRIQLLQELTDLTALRPLPLDTPAQKTVAGFWYINHLLIDESRLAFQNLPDTAVTKELQAVVESIYKLLNAKNLLVDPKLELPERPKEPKRKPTWDAFDKFKLAIRYARLYHQCQDAERRQAAYDMATYQLDEVVKDAAKLPSAERPMIRGLIDLWRKELEAWRSDTRTWQRMKPTNPFIFLEPLRGRKPFVGREGLLKELKQASTRGSLQPILLYGLVKSGKSSLIHKALIDYHEDICFAPFVIPGAENGILSEKQLLWAMCDGLHRRTQQAFPTEWIFQRDPKAATKEMVRAICVRFKTTLTLVIGNVDQLYSPMAGPVLHKMTLTSGSSIADSLFAFWGDLAQSIGNLSFVFISQSADLPANPFTSALKKLQVGNLEQKEVLSLLNTPTPEFIPLFAPLTVAHIYALTGGQPFLVQLIAHCIVDRFNRELDKDNKPEPVFLPADIDDILITEQFEQFSQPYFHNLRGQLESIKPDSNAVLYIIANHPDGISTAELEQSLSSHFGWEKLDDILSFLQTQQIIKLEEGKWQVIGELLRRELRK